MSRPSPDMIRWIALLTVTGLVSVLFIDMVQPFLVALTLAAITAALAQGLQTRMMGVTGQKPGFAAALTLGLLCLGLVAPLLGITYLAALQAESLSEAADALVADLQTISPDDPIPEWVPFRDLIGESSADITAKLGEVAGAAGSWVASALGQLATGAAQFFLDLFVYLYALFLFLQMDRSVIAQVLGYSGLPATTQKDICERIVSVSRATLKGTLVIGAAQGALGAIGFWATGIDGAAFWGVVMAILSIIPGIGPLLIIFFGVLWLFSQGEVTYAIALAVWGMAVVGTIDNILRPILVGRDAALHDILILISTLGGLVMFGAAGLVLGPVLAGIFVTLWDTLSKTTHDAGLTDDAPDALAEQELRTEGDPKATDAVLDEELAAELAELRKKHAAREARKRPK